MIVERFEIGSYRPIYLWGGPGTIRMNRVKFMNQPVNEFAHHEAHSLTGAKKVVDAIYSNWIHLMFDWGFPPEIEEEDWEDFQKGCVNYHDLGVKVFAYIQTSNCVYQGSFQQKDWYAQDAHGKKVFYYTQRYMANLLHPEWQAHIRALIARAIASGADGIFFDNLWDGAMPVSFGGTWLGNAGSYDPISAEKYQQDTGKRIPLEVSQDTPEVREYLTWRINKMSQVVGEFAAHARSIKPDIVIGANDFDMVMRNSPIIYGLNLTQQAHIQDVTMIENYALPKWNEENQVLVNNAQTIRVARELVGTDAHLSVLSYDDGIGWDGMYPPIRFRQTIAEAVACGVTNTIKGTEYYDDHQHTLLTADGYEVQRGAIGWYQRWLESHAQLYQGERENIADVVLVYPEEALVFHWHQTAPIFFAVGQTLLKAGIPWRVIQKHHQAIEAATVLVFTKEDAEELPDAVYIPGIPGWSELIKTSMFARKSWLRNGMAAVLEPLWHGYFSSKMIRRIIDGLKLFRLFTGTKLFDLPAPKLQKELLQQVHSNLPKVTVSQPVLVEMWKKDQSLQLHLVNYANKPQKVQINFDRKITGQIISPDSDPVIEVAGAEITLDLNVYSILIVKE